MARTAGFVVVLMAALGSGLAAAQALDPPTEAWAFEPPRAMQMPQAHATLQMLTELDDGGGVQRVVARAADDATTVRLIRVHLRDLRDQLLHGGRGALEAFGGARHSRIPQPPHGAADVFLAGYRDVPDGGEITYQMCDAALVAALHAWFRALAAEEGANVVIAHRPAADAAGVAR